MALKSVLILTAGFGEGHNAASRNLAAALREAGVAAEVHDAFDEAYGWVNRLVREAYLFVINHAPQVWRLVFWLLDRTSSVGSGVGVFQRAARKIAALVDELRPEVIVSVYPGYGHLLDLLRKRDAIGGAAFVTIVTDSLTINSAWFRCTSDYFLVPNEETATVMRKAGVDAGRVRVTGFPVPLVFSESAVERPAPPYKVLFMVNSAHHLATKVVGELLRLEGIELTVTVGRDEALGRQISSMAKSDGKAVEVFGWTPEIPNLIRRSHLLISKAGGATVQEALAARTPMILTQVVPGQEEGNARLLLESGAGDMAATAPEIARAVARVFAQDAAVYRRMFEATGPLSHPNAARTAAAFLATLA